MVIVMFLYAYSLSELQTILAGNSINSSIVVVSIQSTFHNLKLLPVNPNCIDVLYVRFDDIGYENVSGSLGEIAEIPINSSHADSIIMFVEKYKNSVNDIVFSCNAGMSRSVGTMLAFHRIINNDIDKRLLFHRYNLDYANKMVYDTIITQYEKRIKMR